MIYEDFDIALVSEHLGKQTLYEPYTNKYQKQVACGCGYILVCADDKFSNLFMLYLGEDAAYNV